MLKYFWHSASFPAKCCHGCQVFPWSEDLSSVHTPGLGLFAMVMVMYATWNSLKCERIRRVLYVTSKFILLSYQLNTCCKSISKVTLLYFSPLEMGGDCHHEVTSPSTTMDPGCDLSVIGTFPSGPTEDSHVSQIWGRYHHWKLSSMFNFIFG